MPRDSYDAKASAEWRIKMAIRNIRTLGDEVLTKKAKPVTEMTPKIAELIDDMFDTV